MLADLVSPSSTKADKAVEDAIFQCVPLGLRAFGIDGWEGG